MSKEKTPIEELIEIIDNMAVVKGTPESTISILRNVTAYIRNEAVTLLPKEREAMDKVYKQGFNEGAQAAATDILKR